MDSSKIGQVSFAKFGKIDDVDIITNVSNGNLIKIIKENTKVIEV